MPKISKRQSRYIRPDKKKLGRIELHDRDVEIFKLVYGYRFLRTDHITALIEGDRSSIEKRLRKLWEHRFLNRTFLLAYPGKEPSTRKAIYSIDYRAASVLAKNDFAEPQALKFAIRRNKTDLKYIEHQLIISNFRVALTLALKNKKEAKLLFWRQDNDLRDHVEVVGSGKTKTLPIAPDGYFAIEDERGKMYWFLEADRYTMDHHRFFLKMKAYYLWWEKKGHTDKFDIKNFRVLTICPNNTMLERRLEVTKKVKVAKSNGKEIPVGIKLFWFLSEESYDLAKPESVLKSVYYVARKDEEKAHGLLE
jgi:hypothetical protein